MQNLPTPEVYEKEFKYMPWGILIEEVFNLAKAIPLNSKVLDLMCGPGYLLGKLKSQRPDLDLTGVDLEPEFVEHAKKNNPDINFVTADSSTWESNEKFDLVLVTAGLHHLPYEKQGAFLEKVSNLVTSNGKVIIADPYIDSYVNEEERKIAATKLGYEYLIATINNGGTDDVIKAAIDVMSNDIFLVEFKNSIKSLKPKLESLFSSVELHKTWPKEESEYGDYYFVLSYSKSQL